jgi:membrane peptidoglycan carboxypeptidase
MSGWSKGAHPTLAQWLVSDLVLATEPDSIRKNLRERLLAAQITDEYGREKIMEWYLNSVPYGELIFGADAAAYVYFGKSASSLSLAEAAMLTAISETPSITPSTVSQLLKQQQVQVIQSMLAGGKITREEADKAILEEIMLQDWIAAQSIAPAFTGLVLEQLSAEIPFERLRRGGYEIVTTLDYDFQYQVDCAVKTQAAILAGSRIASFQLWGE